MKKLLFVFFTAFLAINSFSQIQIQTTDSVLLNNDDTLEIIPEQNFYFNVYNASNTAINYSCFATKVVLPSGSTFNICTNGVCADVDSAGQIGPEATLNAESYADPKPDIVYIPSTKSSGEAFVRLKYQNRDDQSDTASICFSVILANALTNTNLDESLIIYPNPANENVHINYNVENNSNLEIYDHLGRKIQSIGLKSKKDEFYLNTSDLQQGIYYIKIDNVAKRMIVVH